MPHIYSTVVLTPTEFSHRHLHSPHAQWEVFSAASPDRIALSTSPQRNTIHDIARNMVMAGGTLRVRLHLQAEDGGEHIILAWEESLCVYTTGLSELWDGPDSRPRPYVSAESLAESRPSSSSSNWSDGYFTESGLSSRSSHWSTEYFTEASIRAHRHSGYGYVYGSADYLAERWSRPRLYSVHASDDYVPEREPRPHSPTTYTNDDHVSDLGSNWSYTNQDIELTSTDIPIVHAQIIRVPEPAQVADAPRRLQMLRPTWTIDAAALRQAGRTTAQMQREDFFRHRDWFKAHPEAGRPNGGPIGIEDLLELGRRKKWRGPLIDGSDIRNL